VGGEFGTRWSLRIPKKSNKAKPLKKKFPLAGSDQLILPGRKLAVFQEELV